MVRLPSLDFSTPACLKLPVTLLVPSTFRLTLPLPSVLIAAVPPVLILVSLMVTLAVVPASALMVMVLSVGTPLLVMVGLLSVLVLPLWLTSCLVLPSAPLDVETVTLPWVRSYSSASTLRGKKAAISSADNARIIHFFIRIPPFLFCEYMRLMCQFLRILYYNIFRGITRELESICRDSQKLACIPVQFA